MKRRILGLPTESDIEDAVARRCRDDCSDDVASTGEARSLGAYTHDNAGAVEVPIAQDPFTEAFRTTEMKTSSIDIGATDTIKDLGGRVSGAFRSRSILCLSVIVASLLLLFIMQQVLSLVSVLATCPGWTAWLGYVMVAVLTMAVLLSLGYLVIRFARLRETPRISLRLLDELHNREQTRREAVKQSALAQKLVERFLIEYPLNEDNFGRLEKLGFDRETRELLADRKQWLCESARSGDRMWLADVNKTFLAGLDEVAWKRIKRYSLQVGVKTAVAPTGFLDSTIAVVNAFLLISDLCEIYHVRTGKWSSFVLLVQVFVNAFAASELEDLTAAAGESLADSLKDSIGGALASAMGWVSPKIAEGTANGLLLARLGHVTIRHLRPIAFK